MAGSSTSFERPNTNQHSRLSKDSTPKAQKEGIIMDAYSAMAKYYDFIVKVTNLGQGTKVRRMFINRVAPKPGAKHIDMSTGTGEIPRLVFEYHEKVNNDHTATIHAVDLNEDMLSVAKEKHKNTAAVAEGRLTFEISNAENLDTIPDNTYDVYTISGGLYNMSNPDKAIKEAYRVLKPGGTFACLEFGKSDSIISWILGSLLTTFLYIIASVVGIKEKVAKIHSSYETFGTQKDIADTARDIGFIVSNKGYENIGSGTAAIILGIKPGGHY